MSRFFVQKSGFGGRFLGVRGILLLLRKKRRGIILGETFLEKSFPRAPFKKLHKKRICFLFTKFFGDP
jgi:hypothetical protein